MQAIESQNLILYQTDLRGQWPQQAAHAFARRLPYARRLVLRAGGSASHASLAGIALALRALTRLLGRRVQPDEIVFARGEKPRLAAPAALAAGDPTQAHERIAGGDSGAAVDFSISHAGPWVACTALAGGRVGLDLEMGTDRRIGRWVVVEAALKASGEGLRALHDIGDLEVREHRVRFRGELWHLRRIEGLAGASCCVLCSVSVPAVETCPIALAELFDA